MPFITGAVAHGVKHIADVYHSNDVYANFVPVALWQNPQGAEAAVLMAINSPTYAVDKATNESTDGDTDELNVTRNQKSLIESGAITQVEVDKGKNAVAVNSDTAPGVARGGETEGTATIEPNVDDTLLYDSPLTGLKYYVKTVTKIPGVIYPYDVATLASENGTTVQKVVDNLRLLVINCFDPIKSKYPDVFMTCSFRKKGLGSSTSQHPFGLACDMQYANISKSEYYNRAVWIRDNLAYDQFILEFKTTGSGLPWHHISFNPAGNRGQVFTFMNDKNCKGPGIIGLYDLGNS